MDQCSWFRTFFLDIVHERKFSQYVHVDSNFSTDQRWCHRRRLVHDATAAGTL